MLAETLTEDEEIELLLLKEMEAIDAARESFLDFVTYTKIDYQVNWHHALIAEKLDQFLSGQIRRLMIFTPPRHGKSELVSRRFPAYAFGKNPDVNIIATSYSADLASAMNRDVQRIIESEEYGRIFPQTKLDGKLIRAINQGRWLKNNDAFEVVGKRGVYRAAGVGGGITGRGADIAIIDDPVKDAKEAYSKTYREAVWNWYVSTLYTRLEKDAGILLTMTRWHEDDLAGRLMRLAQSDPESDKWEVINLPALLESTNIYDPRSKGEALWPAKYDSARLEKIRRNNTRVWLSLFQQRPSADEGNILKRQWFKFYREIPNRFDEVIQSWDMNFKAGKDNSFVVGTVWGRKGPDAFLLYRFRAQIGFAETLKAVARTCEMFPQARKKIVENKANGPGIVSILKKRYPGFIERDPDGSKEARGHEVAPIFESGNVYVPDPDKNPWVCEYIEECVSFPKGEYDDQFDSTTQAIKELFLMNKSSLDDLLKM